MGLILPFILSLSDQRRQVDPEPEPEPIPEENILKLSNEAVEFSGYDLKMDFGSTSVTTSLYYRPKIVHHEGKTYFNYNDRDTVIPYMRSHLLVFDNQRGFDVPRPIGRARSGGDTHSVSVVVVDSNRVFSIQEDLHDSPLRVLQSGPLYDYGYFTAPFSIGTVLSYAHFIKKADGNWMVWTRGIAQPTANYYSLHITEAAAGFGSWGTQRRVSSRPTGDDPFLRHYPFLPWGRVSVAGKIYLVFSARKDDGAGSNNFYRHHILTTPDSGEDSGRVFSNLEETFSHDFDVSGAFADSVAATNWAFWTADTDDIQGFSPVVGVGSGGEVYTIITGTDGTGFFFKYFEPGGGWTTKPISIANLESTLVTASPFSHITAYDHNNIIVVVRIQDGSDVRPHWFKTTNRGTSWTDLGDMRPQFTGTIFPLVPENYLQIPENENFMFPFSREDTEYTGGAMLHCAIASKGSIQSIPGVEVEPAASMNYESTGMFHYKHTNLVLSGSNVTTKTDLFGLRNATGVNNPQFVTDHYTTNGTDSRFTISATGLASLTTLVYMVVARRIPGTLSIFLALSDTAANNEYCEFQIAADGRPCYRIANTSSFLTMTEDAITDETDHVLTFIVAGLNTYIRVDGAFQLTKYNEPINLTHYALAGTGPSTITTVNAVRQGMRDTTSADVFTQTYVKEELLWSGVMPSSEIMVREKALCDEYGITFRNQFQVPA